jgi:cardiolipin synthase
LLQALVDAARRGVDVKLLLPSRSDSALVFNAGRAHYQTLLEGGVKIYERNGAVLHAKTAVIDGVWSTVGSTNLDWRSFRDNDEINAVILGREFAQQMGVMFNQDLDASRQIELHAWNQRSAGSRLKEWMAQLLGRLL